MARKAASQSHVAPPSGLGGLRDRPARSGPAGRVGSTRRPEGERDLASRAIARTKSRGASISPITSAIRHNGQEPAGAVPAPWRPGAAGPACGPGRRITLVLAMPFRGQLVADGRVHGGLLGCWGSALSRGCWAPVRRSGTDAGLWLLAPVRAPTVAGCSVWWLGLVSIGVGARVRRAGLAGRRGAGGRWGW